MKQSPTNELWFVCNKENAYKIIEVLYWHGLDITEMEKLEERYGTA